MKKKFYVVAIKTEKETQYIANCGSVNPHYNHALHYTNKKKAQKDAKKNLFAEMTGLPAKVYKVEQTLIPV